MNESNIFRPGARDMFETYRHNGILIGMVVERRSETVGHYWYVAYDLDLRTESIGMWLLIDSVNRAQENGLTYYYLGTGYNKKIPV
jgi:arginyl-tRNA--protein-N-Asp/Glu arginylyltransferase